MSNEILTPVGRLVQGHPMEGRAVTDDQGQPKINRNGEQQMEFYVGFAVPKGGEQHWNQTQWGQQIHAAGQTGWPTGEWQAAAFAWKIIDGDSTIPNKKGKRPCDQEGFAGHWVIQAKNGFAPDCFAHGNYTQQVMRKETFKTGDYVRLVLSAKGNAPSQSPGVYVNLMGCELVQAGQAIVSASSIDAQSTFGSVAAQLPAGAQIDPNIPAAAAGAPTQPAPPAPGAPQQTAPAAQSVAAPTAAPAVSPAAPVAPAPPPAPTPAPDFLTVNGQQYTPDQLRGFGWTEEQIAAAR